MPDTKANQHDPVVQKNWSDEKYAAYADPETKDNPKLVETPTAETKSTTKAEAKAEAKPAEAKPA